MLQLENLSTNFIFLFSAFAFESCWMFPEGVFGYGVMIFDYQEEILILGVGSFLKWKFMRVVSFLKCKFMRVVSFLKLKFMMVKKRLVFYRVVSFWKTNIWVWWVS